MKRKRRKQPKSKWKLISHYPITDYKCGAHSGDRVRLRRDIVVRDIGGKPTGTVFRAGEIWTVINGVAEPPLDVWLGRSNGERVTWEDGDDFWNWFQRVVEDAG